MQAPRGMSMEDLKRRTAERLAQNNSGDRTPVQQPLIQQQQPSVQISQSHEQSQQFYSPHQPFRPHQPSMPQQQQYQQPPQHRQLQQNTEVDMSRIQGHEHGYPMNTQQAPMVEAVRSQLPSLSPYPQNAHQQHQPQHHPQQLQHHHHPQHHRNHHQQYHHQQHHHQQQPQYYPHQPNMHQPPTLVLSPPQKHHPYEHQVYEIDRDRRISRDESHVSNETRRISQESYSTAGIENDSRRGSNLSTSSRGSIASRNSLVSNASSTGGHQVGAIRGNHGPTLSGGSGGSSSSNVNVGANQTMPNQTQSSQSVMTVQELKELTKQRQQEAVKRKTLRALNKSESMIERTNSEQSHSIHSSSFRDEDVVRLQRGSSEHSCHSAASIFAPVINNGQENDKNEIVSPSNSLPPPSSSTIDASMSVKKEDPDSMSVNEIANNSFSSHQKDYHTSLSGVSEENTSTSNMLPAATLMNRSSFIEATEPKHEPPPSSLNKKSGSTEESTQELDVDQFHFTPSINKDNSHSGSHTRMNTLSSNDSSIHSPASFTNDHLPAQVQHQHQLQHQHQHQLQHQLHHRRNFDIPSSSMIPAHMRNTSQTSSCSTPSPLSTTGLAGVYSDQSSLTAIGNANYHAYMSSQFPSPSSHQIPPSYSMFPSSLASSPPQHNDQNHKTSSNENHHQNNDDDYNFNTYEVDNLPVNLTPASTAYASSQPSPLSVIPSYLSSSSSSSTSTMSQNHSTSSKIPPIKLIHNDNTPIYLKKASSSTTSPHTPTAPPPKQGGLDSASSFQTPSWLGRRASKSKISVDLGLSWSSQSNTPTSTTAVVVGSGSGDNGESLTPRCPPSDLLGMASFDNVSSNSNDMNNISSAVAEFVLKTPTFDSPSSINGGGSSNGGSGSFDMIRRSTKSFFGSMYTRSSGSKQVQDEPTTPPPPFTSAAATTGAGVMIGGGTGSAVSTFNSFRSHSGTSDISDNDTQNGTGTSADNMKLSGRIFGRVMRRNSSINNSNTSSTSNNTPPKTTTNTSTATSTTTTSTISPPSDPLNRNHHHHHKLAPLNTNSQANTTSLVGIPDSNLRNLSGATSISSVSGSVSGVTTNGSGGGGVGQLTPSAPASPMPQYSRLSFWASKTKKNNGKNNRNVNSSSSSSSGGGGGGGVTNSDNNITNPSSANLFGHSFDHSRSSHSSGSSMTGSIGSITSNQYGRGLASRMELQMDSSINNDSSNSSHGSLPSYERGLEAVIDNEEDLNTNHEKFQPTYDHQDSLSSSQSSK